MARNIISRRRNAHHINNKNGAVCARKISETKRRSKHQLFAHARVSSIVYRHQSIIFGENEIIKHRRKHHEENVISMAKLVTRNRRGIIFLRIINESVSIIGRRRKWRHIFIFKIEIIIINNRHRHGVAKNKRKCAYQIINNASWHHQSYGATSSSARIKHRNRKRNNARSV